MVALRVLDSFGAGSIPVVLTKLFQGGRVVMSRTVNAQANVKVGVGSIPTPGAKFAYALECAAFRLGAVADVKQQDRTNYRGLAQSGSALGS